MRRIIASWLSRAILKLWPFFLVVVIVLSAASLPRTVRLFKTISTDPVDLLPRDSPNVQSLLQVREKLEKGTRASIVFESDDPRATVRFLEDTVAKLRAMPQVGKVIDKKVGYDFFNKHKALYLELEDLKTIRDRIQRRIEKEKLGPLYLDLEGEGGSDLSFEDLHEKYGGGYADESESAYNVSPDGRVYAISVDSRPENNSLSEASQFQDALEDFVGTLRPQGWHPTMKVYLSGASKVIEYRALMKDLKRVGLISGFLIFLPLLIRFRNPFHVGLIFLPLIVGLPISFATASFVVSELNVSTSFLFAILGGLGIENGIHIFSRYHEVRTAGRGIKDAIEDIFRHTGPAILTSVASVAVTFLLMVINDFRGFSEFGLIAGLGLWVLFAVYFTFFPSLLLFLEKVRVLKKNPPLPPFDKGGLGGFRIPSQWLKGSLAAFLLFSLFSVAAAPFLQFEFNSKKIRADVPEVRLAKEKQRMTTRRVNNPASLVIHGREEADALQSTLEQRKRGDRTTPTIDTARSYYDLIPQDQEERLQVIHEIRKLLSDPALRLASEEQRRDAKRFEKILTKTDRIEWKEIPTEVLEVFRGKPEVPGKIFYVNALPHLELDDGRNAMNFADDVARIDTNLGTYYPSSDAVIYGIVLKTMLQDSKKVLAISLLSVAFFVFLDFKNLRKTAIAMLSIVLGVLWLFGVMFLFGIKLNFYNMVIIPAVMGMSIDNAVHILHRYRELGRGSLPKVLSTTGIAALLSSLTNASGFFGLLFCVHRGLYSVGLVAVIGIATCLVSTLVFLPGLLRLLEGQKKY